MENGDTKTYLISKSTSGQLQCNRVDPSVTSVSHQIFRIYIEDSQIFMQQVSKQSVVYKCQHLTQNNAVHAQQLVNSSKPHKTAQHEFNSKPTKSSRFVEGLYRLKQLAQPHCQYLENFRKHHRTTRPWSVRSRGLSLFSLVILFLLSFYLLPLYCKPDKQAEAEKMTSVGCCPILTFKDAFPLRPAVNS